MPFQHSSEQYCSIPTRTPGSCLSLAAVLLVDAPKQAIAPVKARLERIKVKAETLQEVWNDSTRPSELSEDARPYDFRLDRSWSVIRARIEHWVTIDHPTRRERAEELGQLLFPTGLDFLHLRYHEEWAESQRRLALIEEDELEADLVQLVDPAFVTELKEAHAKYGEVLGITVHKDAPAGTVGVLDALKALRKEMAAYAHLLLGLVDPDDDKGIAATEAALAGIIRARKPRGGSGSEDKQAAEGGEGAQEGAAEVVEDELVADA